MAGMSIMKLFGMGALLWLVAGSGCASPVKGTYWSIPAGHTQADFDRDWHHCAVHSQLSQGGWYSGQPPLPSPPDHPQQNTKLFITHKSTNGMIETCMASRGYRVE